VEKKPLIGIFICMLLIVNVSAVRGIPEEKITTTEKKESNTFVKLFDQEDKMYTIINMNSESETPRRNVVGPNLAPNPSFEEGDTIPTGWTYNPNTNGIYTWDSNHAHSGEKSIGVLNLTNNSNSSDLMWTTLDFIPVDCILYSYMFIAWFRFVEKPPDCHFAMLRVLEYDINYQFIEQGGFGIGSVNNTEWQGFGFSFSYNNNTKYVKLQAGQEYIRGEPDPSVEIRFDDINYSIWSTAPNTPTITGETQGQVRTIYNYTITTTDPDNDNVHYEINWGDNTTQITGLHESGEEIVINHTWNVRGTYIVRVRAIDMLNLKSDWAALTVTMPCSHKIPIQSFWGGLLERYPNAFPIIRYLLEFIS
jgi:hypothetical protein